VTTIYPNLSEKMLDFGASVTDIAKLLGEDVSVITDKFQGVLPWFLHEAIAICAYLGTSNIEKLFVRIDINT
jgi:hypothetical protein